MIFTTILGIILYEGYMRTCLGALTLWQQSSFQLCADCFMSRNPVSNAGLRISKTPSPTQSCVESLTGWAHTQNDLHNHSGYMDSVNGRQHYLKPSLDMSGSLGPNPKWSLQSIVAVVRSYPLHNQSGAWVGASTRNLSTSTSTSLSMSTVRVEVL